MNYLEHERTFPNRRANAGPDQTCYGLSDLPREGALLHVPAEGHPQVLIIARVGAGPSGMPTRVAATLLQGTFVADGPWVGQLDDQLAKVLPGDPGEDWMSEGRVGACWRRHPCIIVRPPHFLNRGDRPDALLSTPAEAASW
jgi:hypothetical protein